jgi:dihydrofolate reductase
VETVTSLEQALSLVNDVEEAMIIGGGSFYEHCMPMANKLYLTYIDANVDGDTQFPDWGEGWKQVHSEQYQADEKNAYDMQFVILER